MHSQVRRFSRGDDGRGNHVTGETARTRLQRGAGRAHDVRVDCPVALGRNVYPQKHHEENQDRIEHDPHDVGSPTPLLLYSLLAHGGCP
jgi:hypothetical protein